jgi:hypothetical protein
LRCPTVFIGEGVLFEHSHVTGGDLAKELRRMPSGLSLSCRYM